MANDIVDRLANFKDEVEWIEFKLNHHDPQKIGEYLSALSNSASIWSQKYGYIIWGIDQSKNQIVGTDFKPRETKGKGNEDLESWLSHGLFPRVDLEIIEDEWGGKRIVIFKVGAAIDQPIKFWGTAFIRIGSYKHPLRDFPEKERKIWNNPSDFTFESQIAVSNQSSDDVLKKINYPRFFKLLEQPLPDNKESILKKLEEEGVIQRNNESFNITNLGAILFANYLTDFPKLSHKTVRVIVFSGNDRVQTSKDIIIPDGYAVLFESTVNFIMDLLPSNEIIKDALRFEQKLYPKKAIREFLANALIHQDFSITGTGPTVEIFKDRLEIINPGRPLIEPIRFIDHPPISRNEKLASLMRRMNVCEERGSGIDRAIGEIEVFQLPAPYFKAEDDFTQIILFSFRELNKMEKDDKVRACYQHCCLKYICNDLMTNTSLRNRFGIKEQNYPIASLIIKETMNAKLIEIANPENKSPRMRIYKPYWA